MIKIRKIERFDNITFFGHSKGIGIYYPNELQSEYVSYPINTMEKIDKFFKMFDMDRTFSFDYYNSPYAKYLIENSNFKLEVWILKNMESTTNLFNVYFTRKNLFDYDPAKFITKEYKAKMNEDAFKSFVLDLFLLRWNLETS